MIFLFSYESRWEEIYLISIRRTLTFFYIENFYGEYLVFLFLGIGFHALIFVIMACLAVGEMVVVRGPEREWWELRLKVIIEI
jgi:hypothetical protein